ncbi:MAG: peptidoglycan DD-metalloendopeptidase family protein [Candidatus Merdivicinus sp.]|jgi:murein DD-endopeptidase MepM/ murein hydrolase activator NlpD
MEWQVREKISNLKERVDVAWQDWISKIQESSFRQKLNTFCNAACKKVAGQASSLCIYTSRAAVESTRDLRAAISSVSEKTIVFSKELLHKTSAFLAQKCSAFAADVAVPFIKLYHLPAQTMQHYREGGWNGTISYLYCGIRNNSRFFSTILNYTAPVFGILILCNVVSSAMQVNYALQVTNNGEYVGYVTDEAVLTNAQDMLRQRIIHTDGTQANIELNPELTVVAVNESLISDADEMTDNLIRMSNEDISEAQGLYIDGDFYGAVTDTTMIEEILNQTLDQYRTGAEGEVVSFVKDIELREGLYLTESLVSSEEMENLLLSNQQSERVYIVEEGDSPIQIANKNGLTYAEFKALNPDIEESCMIGQETLISTEKPFLSVRVVRQETTTEEIAYETETTKDNSQYVGYTKTVQEGKNGTQQVTASVEYVDGYETSREILSTEVIEEPVTKKVVEGTKQKETYSSGKILSASSGSGNYGGNFLWPVSSGGYISCYYSSGHRAIDIACPYGTAILASASGRVILAGWYDSYGKAVIIDHGNGVQTLYAHNSSLNVSVGDYVSQGQVIAGAGSTGYSFGNHCHFEVRINGGRYNPLNYLN